ncbi:RNA polymerase, sigma subunit, ECF family [Actinacidiphila yanglinensis]|uniref:RNA polymerase sigma factor n=1 Tax=Actinacidiphila yanglinensis TaxID=310779 RepID=A0A1H6DUG5_9ACTN|nr:RNA polymerase subunit sigma-70 [Actinacidiphila yanglinensis]SEG88931.1 RNA polymerase, sigma subunit, ECF family [Actinacidiphila yanglinensis]
MAMTSRDVGDAVPAPVTDADRGAGPPLDQDAAVLARARAGDGEAFRQLTDPYRRELQVHCYRMLGSLQDAEDLLQETLLSAWRGLSGFEGRSSVRTWLYRIATNRCLNALRAGTRHPRLLEPIPLERPLPEPTARASEPVWMEPYPDVLLAGLPDHAPGPEARYETREAVSLAFLVALQHLPPRQRAVLVLRDVLGYRAAEVAAMMVTTENAVHSALSRARAALASRERLAADRESAPLPDSWRERQVVADFARAFESGDVDAVLALLTDDAWLTMPPLALEYQGLAAIGNFLGTIAFRGRRSYALVPTRANGQPAFGIYLRLPGNPFLHAHGVLLMTLEGDRVSAITRFMDGGLLPLFGLPRSLRE